MSMMRIKLSKPKPDKLIDRIYRYGVTTVYLQAFSDPDGDGVSGCLVFPK